MTTAIELDILLERLATVIGAEHVGALTADAHYGTLLGPALPAEQRPRAVVKPASPEELQALVKLVATLDHALWVTPNGCGNGARAGQRHKPAVLADLSRMTRIIEIDRASAYALVEPGVSYTQLAQYIADAKLPLWIDCDKNGAHSVAGSVCERALGYTPYSDHLLMQCGFEVVLADGTLMRTGMGALPGNNTWQLFKYNFGPYLDGLFSRADFGIVTKVGLWIMPAPPAWHPFMVTLPDAAAVAAAVELLRPFKIDMSLPGSVVISSRENDLALLKRSRPQDADAVTALSDPQRSGAWNLYGAVCGLPANVDFIWSLLGPGLAALPGAKVFTEHDGRNDWQWQTRTQLMRGVPAYDDDGAHGNNTLWFTASAPLEGSDANTMHEIAAKHLREVDHHAEYVLGWRTLFLRITIMYDAGTYAAHRKAALAAIKALIAAGYAISHDSFDLTAEVTSQHTGKGLQHLYHGLRQALDPAGLFGPRNA